MASTLRLVHPINLPDVADSDAAVLARARADRSAFAPIYHRYAADIYRYCYRCLGSREDAEDATSQVFTQAIGHLHQLRDDNIRSWIYRIAHNVVIDKARRERPTASLAEIHQSYAVEPSPESHAIAAERSERVLAAMETLSPRDRQLVLLRLNGLTGEEIATVLGITHGTVRVAHHRAIERLRAILADEEKRRD